MDNIPYALKISSATLGVVLGSFLGGLNGALYGLLLFVGLDYITGVLVAIKLKCLNSEIGFWGLVKKVLIFILVGVGNVIDQHLIGSGDVFRDAVVFFFMANEGLSLLENIGNLGVDYPKRLKSMLEQLKDKEGE